MTLLLDVGNSRVKAGLVDAGLMTPVGAVAFRESGIGPALESLEDLPAEARAVVACCVAGSRTRAELAAWAAERYDLEVRFVTAGARACGVTNGYQEPGRLGADRWAAVIGAHARGVPAACVVDAGSALTIDGLVGGQHLGGLIIPGLSMMRMALFRDTGDLASLSEAPLEGGRPFFATDTHEAIVRGSLLAAGSLIRQCRREMARRVGQSPVILVTGGDAEQLLPMLDEYTEHAPWLTLEGLARLALAPETG